VASRILVRALVIAIIAFALLIVFLGQQLLYESQADGYFQKGEFEKAAERYQRALGVSSIFGNAKYLFMTGRCYQNLREYEHAMDFYMQVLRDFPRSSWAVLAQPEAERILGTLGTVPFEVLKASTPLAQAYQQLRVQYGRLMLALKDNRSGLSAGVEAEYEAYKRYFAAFKQQRTLVWQEYRKGRVPETTTPEPSPSPEASSP
jgi:tetratricopeptide (TPR) repeat protein